MSVATISRMLYPRQQRLLPQFAHNELKIKKNKQRPFPSACLFVVVLQPNEMVLRRDLVYQRLHALHTNPLSDLLVFLGLVRDRKHLRLESIRFTQFTNAP